MNIHLKLTDEQALALYRVTCRLMRHDIGEVLGSAHASLVGHAEVARDRLAVALHQSLESGGVFQENLRAGS